MAKTYEKRASEVKYSIMNWEDYSAYNPDATYAEYQERVAKTMAAHPDRGYLIRTNSMVDDLDFYTYPIKTINPFTGKWEKVGEKVA